MAAPTYERSPATGRPILTDGMTRIVTWNMRGAPDTSPAWQYFSELSPDIALLQEVGKVPGEIRDEFSVLDRPAVNKLGTAQRFRTAVLARYPLEPIQLRNAEVQAELDRYAGNLVACRIGCERPLMVTSVYSPAWPIDDLPSIRLDYSMTKRTPKTWLTDLLASALIGLDLVGGDFNLSSTFNPMLNQQYLDRVASLGYVECLRTAQSRVTPTFRNPRGGRVIHQLDHLFVTTGLAPSLTACDVGSEDRVFGGGLSDHLPVVADFDESLISGLVPSKDVRSGAG
jgi:exonuclease III